MIYKIFDKKSTSSGIKSMSNQQLADELHKPIIRKFKRRSTYSSFKDNICAADLANSNTNTNINAYTNNETVIYQYKKMLYYNKIDVSERIDINKSNKSKGCMICHYWYFKDIGYKFEPYMCNGCHDLSRWLINQKILQYLI